MVLSFCLVWGNAYLCIYWWGKNKKESTLQVKYTVMGRSLGVEQALWAHGAVCEQGLLYSMFTVSNANPDSYPPP